MINVYYNQKTNKIALGLMISYIDLQLYLIVGENKDKELEVTPIKDVLDYQVVGEYGEEL